MKKKNNNVSVVDYLTYKLNNINKHTLYKVDTKMKHYRFVSIDTETVGKNNDFYMMGVIDYNDDYIVFYDKIKAIEYLRRLKHNDIRVVATNLGFDFNVLATGTNLVNKCDFIVNNGRYIQIKMQSSYGQVFFWDSFNYGSLSVASMGEIIKSSKMKKPRFLGKTPKNEKEKKELEEYNRQDCLVTKRFMEFLQESLNNLGGELKCTISSSTMDLFRRRYFNDEILKENIALGLSVKEFIRNAYYGGRCEVFKRGYLTDYNYYDFNSLYPSVMLCEFPDPNSVMFCGDEDRSLLKYEGVSFFKLEIPKCRYPLLPYRYKNKLVFPYGTFSGYYTHVEIRQAIKLYGKQIIKKMNTTVYYTKTKVFFKDFVNDMYTLRKQFKAENNPMQLVTKLCLNSLYGRWGLKNVSSTTFFVPEDKQEIADKIKSNKSSKFYINEDQTECYYTDNKEFDGNTSFPIWSVYTSSYGRLKLHEAILKVDPVYVDTDSLITKSTMEDSKELGELKLEKTIKEMILIKPKLYFLDDEIKTKGIPSPKDPKDKIRIKNKILKGKGVSYVKFVKPKEAIRRKLMVNSKLLVTKYIDLEDTKRLWKNKFDPQTSEDSEAIQIKE